MIAKKIHYVWVGNKQKPELVLKCIEIWKKYCPDYEIIEWNNDSLKNIRNQYVQEAYEEEKWAFVSDYLRLYAIKTQGGFYCDADLEITNSLDEFLDLDFITGYENYKGNIAPVTALMGASKNNKVITDLLKEYDDIHFRTPEGLDQTTNVVRITNYFKKQYSFQEPYDEKLKVELEKGVVIFPSHYFCKEVDNKKNYSIHHFNGSWLDTYKRKLIFAIGNYSLIKFKKVKNREEDLPIKKAEKILFKTPLCFKRVFVMIKADY